jgi:hypothetical protein
MSLLVISERIGKHSMIGIDIRGGRWLWMVGADKLGLNTLLVRWVNPNPLMAE